MSTLCRHEGDGDDYRGRDEKFRVAMPSLRRRHRPGHCQESPPTTTVCAYKSRSNPNPRPVPLQTGWIGIWIEQRRLCRRAVYSRLTP